MLPGKMEEALLVVNNTTFVDNDNELESLLQPFQSMKHGVKFNLIPHEYGGKASMIMDDEEIQRTIDNTTQYYLTVECKECEEPCRHFKSRVPALRAKPQNESMSSDSYFPSIRSRKHLLTILCW